MKDFSLFFDVPLIDKQAVEELVGMATGSTSPVKRDYQVTVYRKGGSLYYGWDTQSYSPLTEAEAIEAYEAFTTGKTWRFSGSYPRDAKVTVSRIVDVKTETKVITKLVYR
jgi:hypothetical protein